MIRVIVFDFDGVLYDCADAHFEALNLALEDVNPKFIIGYEEHLNKYDGLTTLEKITILVKEKQFPSDKIEITQINKRNNLNKILSGKVKPSESIINTFKKLKSDGYKLCVASNAERIYVLNMLRLLNLFDLVDDVFTRDDCGNTKPHSEIYLRAILKNGVNPKQTLILEDTLIGHRSAVESGANLFVIENIVRDVTYESIKSQIYKFENSNYDVSKYWFGDNINVVIPMAGAGSRFQRAGYPVPKPLIDVNGKPMIQVSTDFINLPNAKFTFIVQKEHNEKYGLGHLLRAIRPGANIVEVNGLTEGAACTVLHAKEIINDTNHLIISNCDQYIELNWANYFNQIKNKKADGSCVCFHLPDNDNKWSYAKVNNYGWISSVKEKQKISDFATSGIYHFKNGKDFIYAAETMINLNDRVNNEFYVAPTFNYLIERGNKIMNFMCEKMMGLGDPEQYTNYLKLTKK